MERRHSHVSYGPTGDIRPPSCYRNPSLGSFSAVTSGSSVKLSKSALFNAAKRWDAATIAPLLKAAPELVKVADPKGRTALHIACAVKSAKALGEPDGIRTVTGLLKAGADL